MATIGAAIPRNPPAAAGRSPRVLRPLDRQRLHPHPPFDFERRDCRYPAGGRRAVHPPRVDIPIAGSLLSSAMSEIAQAIANRQSEIDRLQAEIKALTDVEQILGASAPAARSTSRRSSSPTKAAAAADSKSEAKPARKFGVDLVIAAQYMAESTQWAKAFVAAAKSNRVHAVVASRAEP